MKIVYNQIYNMRGNLITVHAEGVRLGDLACIDLKDGRVLLASVLRIEENAVTLQVFQSTRGISTGDRVTFLNKPMQVVFGSALLGRRLSGSGQPIDGGPRVLGEAVDIG